MTGWAETHSRALFLVNARLTMPNFTKYPAHGGHVTARDACDFRRDKSVSPIGQGFHWNQNGETCFMMAKSMGDLMVELLEPSP